MTSAIRRLACRRTGGTLQLGLGIDRPRHRPFVASDASALPADPVIVVTNPDEDCSPAAFRAMIDELLSSPELDLESVDAAEALRELRTDAE